jgi:predicted metal-dependent HD superfamily phosphohydrolase
MSVSGSLISEAIRSELVKCYTASDRYYHDLRHVEALLALMREHLASLADPVAVEAAIWFHDAIYDTHRNDNEQRSADLARERLAPLASSEQVDRIAAMILATAHHALPGGLSEREGGDCALFLDMDLAILGAAASEFAAYEQAVRREYGWVPEPMWIAGRRRVLESFLARPSIYARPGFRASHETAARHNIAQALARLTGGA